jgi:hypothetical protein
MSATTLEATESEAGPGSHRSSGSVGDVEKKVAERPGGRQAPSRPAGRSGRSLAPRSRPVHPLSAPSWAPTGRSRARACRVEAQQSPANHAVRDARVRITDRGIAVVLVTAAMIVLAAATVVGLTALRVTGDHYQPLSTSQVLQP